ncbi:ABC transporter substrate-binding protein [Actinophytocola algeriensis]|uniref:Iron complex transport system substrate-binding protein n=1 Tax=Actinophytocola algeriensis TaxID=1768010 RepID=A0A7W7Q9F2_9PSEU|nr:ABC transporter substrate-binding protein [Actinophytocola algeriensis]MBB4909486.1 iron complex transport system substrate-binding protein [Actinophytocola algeriensis]MBE1475476.1 iron complex transport system substrate-binding protein [Actinophytocola algeriensis]
MKVRTVLVALGALCLATTAACATTTTAEESGDQATSAAYPVTITNCGKEYTYDKAPSRVVVMNGGSVAEVSALLELGLGDKIVANAQSYGDSEVPGRVDEIKALPTGDIELNEMMDIPREAMIGLTPDFVISTYDGGFRAEAGFATRDDLAKIGANTYAPESACGDVGTVSHEPTIEDSYAMLRDLGKIFGVSDKAEKIIADSEERIAAIEKKVADAPELKAMLIIPGMAMGDQFSSVGDNGIWNDIMAKAGVTNAFAGASENMFTNPSKEQVAKADIDALVVVNYQSPDSDADAQALFDQFPQWDAAKDKRYVVLSDSIYLGPSNAVAVEEIAKAFHPDAF